MSHRLPYRKKTRLQLQQLRTLEIEQTENIMNLCGLSHNIKRLYNIKHDIFNKITELDNFLEKLLTLFETELIATIK